MKRFAMCIVVLSVFALAAACGGSAAAPLEPVAAGQARLFLVTPDDDVDLDAVVPAVGARLLLHEIKVIAVQPQEPGTIVVDIGLFDLEAAEDLFATEPQISFRPVLEYHQSNAPDVTPDIASEPVVFTTLEAGGSLIRYSLGPSVVDGSGVAAAENLVVGGGDTWGIALELTQDANGIDAFNELAGRCFDGAPQCPTKQLAIALDGVVLTAPTVQVPTFDYNSISISGGIRTEEHTFAVAALIANPTLAGSFNVDRVETG